MMERMKFDNADMPSYLSAEGVAPIHNLINWRVATSEGGFMHYGKAGQGVRLFGPRLDLTSHGPGMRHMHKMFGLKAAK